MAPIISLQPTMCESEKSNQVFEIGSWNPTIAITLLCNRNMSQHCTSFYWQGLTIKRTLKQWLALTFDPWYPWLACMLWELMQRKVWQSKKRGCPQTSKQKEKNDPNTTTRVLSGSKLLPSHRRLDCAMMLRTTMYQNTNWDLKEQIWYGQHMTGHDKKI